MPKASLQNFIAAVALLLIGNSAAAADTDRPLSERCRKQLPQYWSSCRHLEERQLAGAKAAVAAQAKAMKIERFTTDGRTGEAIIKFHNTGSDLVEWMTVDCAFLDKDGVAVDTGIAIFRDIGAGETAYEKAGTMSGGLAETVRCRVSRRR